MQAIATAIGFVIEKLVGLVDWLGRLAVAIFAAMWHLVTDAVCWAFDQLLSVATIVLGGISFDALASHAGAWAGLPSMVTEVLSAIGITQALGIVVAAITIRLMLQLVPFTRLGS